jgi:malate dehydrogenase
VAGTAPGDWTSVALPSSGEYGVPEGLVCSFPAASEGGAWRVVPDLELSPMLRARFDDSIAELSGERDAVRSLGLL